MSLDIGLYIDVDTGGDEMYEVCLYSDSISHNFAPIWKKVGIHRMLYYTEEIVADGLIDSLYKAISEMVSNPDQCIVLNPPNDYENYDVALESLTNFYKACKLHPKSMARMSI